ncbi:MAG TPA: hypothetical protein VNO70_02080 [Blastocatellia bacterium]|nr:hypothetical protein [Blastocatellia bacterium]
MTPYRHFWNGALAIFLLITGGPSHQDTVGQHKSPPAGKLLQKSANLADASLSNNARQDVAIRLYNLQPTDFVNIRPKEGRLAASAGALMKTLRTPASIPSELSYRSFPIETIAPGPMLPESSLEVKPAEVTFVRPALSNNIVFLDLEVPTGARIQVFVDGELVLRASLRRPLSLRNQEWGEGALGIPGTAVRAAMPLARNSILSEHPVYDRSSGSYFVPFSKLQVVKKRPIIGEQGQSIVVVLQIDETGRVVKVTPLTDSPPVNLEEIMKKWQFAPYVIEGRPVPVTTSLRIMANN